MHWYRFYVSYTRSWEPSLAWSLSWVNLERSFGSSWWTFNQTDRACNDRGKFKEVARNRFQWGQHYWMRLWSMTWTFCFCFIRPTGTHWRWFLWLWRLTWVRRVVFLDVCCWGMKARRVGASLSFAVQMWAGCTANDGGGWHCWGPRLSGVMADRRWWTWIQIR